jgi:NADH:ubiquinone oxidoreductase subunit D
MSDLYKRLENQINNLDNISDYNERVIMMKEIKEEILLEKEVLENLMSSVLKNEVAQLDYPENKKKKIEEEDLTKLMVKFSEAKNLDQKIKLYHMINLNIDKMEKELFN